MNKFRSGLVFLFVIILAGCGGNNDVPGKPKFAAQVSFGDSLSDVGTYDVGVVAFYGGGQFTINAASTVKATTPTNWTEFTSLSLGLGMPCAAETGLDDTAGAYRVASAVHATCTGYAQGGSRVTQQPGIGNKALGGFALTVPVGTQIQNFLTAHAGSFSGNEIVTLMAGANDVFYQAGLVSASAVTATSAVAAVQAAATELAADVNTQIVGKGAKYVVVANIPDIASTPQVTSIANLTVRAQTGGLLDTLVTAFNAQLKASLPDSATVLNVDAYTASKDEVANPLKYNLTNVADTACNLNTPPNPFASSLGCNANNLNLVVDPNLTSGSHYLFADKVHPTPYGHLLFATYVLQAMTNKGWY